MLEIGIISLFPEMFAALDASIPGRAQQSGLLKLHFWNPRDFAGDKHQTVDDSPYGGGPGMVMKVEPLRSALQAAKLKLGEDAKVIYLSPQGNCFNQAAASNFTKAAKLILIAGRYEGVDQRFIDHYVDEQWSIGDYVISGGELAAMVVIDAITRLVPGALGAEGSAQQDSFAEGLLDYPHYTRPADIDGMCVPKVLLAGNHQAIADWRLQQALGQTWLNRPDLLEKRELNAVEKQLLKDFIDEYQTIRSET